jgi:hypothetical protein
MHQESVFSIIIAARVRPQNCFPLTVASLLQSCRAWQRLRRKNRFDPKIKIYSQKWDDLCGKLTPLFHFGIDSAPNGR